MNLIKDDLPEYQKNTTLSSSKLKTSPHPLLPGEGTRVRFFINSKLLFF